MQIPEAKDELTSHLLLSSKSLQLRLESLYKFESGIASLKNCLNLNPVTGEIALLTDEVVYLFPVLEALCTKKKKIFLP